MGVQHVYCVNGDIIHGFNSHTARGSSTKHTSFTLRYSVVSIPILRVGVQPKSGYDIAKFLVVSIPILRVGVQRKDNRFQHICSIQFQFPYCAWEFNLDRFSQGLPDPQFQFPYCAWEFNLTKIQHFPGKRRFNSHTARGSSTEVVPVTIDFQNGFNSHTARGSSTSENNQTA